MYQRILVIKIIILSLKNCTMYIYQNLTIYITPGTKKYPDVAYFDKFVTENGGDENAYTDQKNTVYYYDINNSSFEKSIDIFSQFFKAPLLDEQYVNKEINAVNSEFQGEINSDSDRIYQIVQLSAHPDSPFRKFITGNLKTLQKEGTFQVLREFYDRYYR